MKDWLKLVLLFSGNEFGYAMVDGSIAGDVGAGFKAPPPKGIPQPT
jgi:hypothetical protein